MKRKRARSAVPVSYVPTYGPHRYNTCSIPRQRVVPSARSRCVQIFRPNFSRTCSVQPLMVSRWKPAAKGADGRQRHCIPEENVQWQWNISCAIAPLNSSKNEFTDLNTFFTKKKVYSLCVLCVIVGVTKPGSENTHIFWFYEQFL